MQKKILLLVFLGIMLVGISYASDFIQNPLKDAAGYSTYPTYNGGTSVYIPAMNTISGSDFVGYIMFDIKEIIEENVSIIDSTLKLKLPSINCEVARNISIYDVMVYNWSEGTHSSYTDVGEVPYEEQLTWNNQMCGTAFDNSELCNLTPMQNLSISLTSWKSFNVLPSLHRVVNENKNNVSFALRVNEQSDDCKFYPFNFASKDYIADTTLIPILDLSFTFNQPEVKLKEPLNNYKVNWSKRPFVFNFTINDSTYTIKNATLFLGNYSLNLNANVTNNTIVTNNTNNITNFPSINIDRGSYEWNVQACQSDDICKNATNNRTINITNTIPYDLNLTYPIDDYVISASTTWLNFSAKDNDIGDNITYWIYADTNSNPGTLLVNLTNITSYSFSGLADNTRYYWKVVAADDYDYVNTSNSIIESFITSLSGPAININNVTNNSWKSPSLAIDFTATDADGISDCQLWLNSTGWHLNQTKTGITSGVADAFSSITLDNENYYKYNIYCNDTSNNFNWYPLGNVTFGVDTIKPNLTISSPTNGATYTSKTITFTTEKNDTFYSNCSYSLVGTTTEISNAACNSSFTTAFNDVYTLTATVYDLVGNSNSSSVTFETQLPPTPSSGGSSETKETIIIQKGANVTEELAKLIVCGNGVCQEEETYFNCKQDCPASLEALIFCLPFIKEIPILNKLIPADAVCTFGQTWFVNVLIIIIIVFIFLTKQPKKEYETKWQSKN